MAQGNILKYLDNLRLSEGKNAELDEQIFLTFNTPYGAKVLEYLQRVTVNRVLDSNATDTELRMLEGKRQLYTYLKERMMAHQRRKRGVLIDG